MKPTQQFSGLRCLHLAAGALLTTTGALTQPSHAAAMAPATTYQSHAPVRPLPVAISLPLTTGPRYFVDGMHGSDDSVGSQQSPWKTVASAIRHLKAGDTLYLRGGTYYEKVSLGQSGTAAQPITIASFPGEIAVLDGGLREFLESPSTAWEPFPGGGPGEFVSTGKYGGVDATRGTNQALPEGEDAMEGLEHERPLALGNFADSMLPLHGYRIAADMRATNEFWLEGKNAMLQTGIYGGPGLWFDRGTGRIHIRLAHTQLAGLGDDAYNGETDPRKVPLIIAVGFGDELLRLNGVQHVRLQGLELRGGTGSAIINVSGSQDIAMDRLTVYGGSPALMVDASKDVKVTHSAFRGLAAPWISRALMKYRGTASYQVVMRNHEPMNDNIELAWREFTDGHDFAHLRSVKNLQFHHNFVDNFNDDGLECGPKLRGQSQFIYQNRIERCLSPMTQHQGKNDNAPVENDPKDGMFVFRNVFDLRGGTYKFPPTAPDATGAYLHQEGSLAGDHGSPIWPELRFYQNTVLRQGPVFRDLYLFGLGASGTQQTSRDVFNNIFVEADKLPGVAFIGMKQAENVREGGNLIWGVNDGPTLTKDPFATFRASALYADSRNRYAPGWTTQDKFADPKFVNISAQDVPVNLQLQTTSPAVKAGQKLPAEWPDPLRGGDAPDSGAIPLGAKAWGVGVDGRLPLFDADQHITGRTLTAKVDPKN